MRSVALDLAVRKISYCEIEAGQVLVRRTVTALSSLKDLLGPGCCPVPLATPMGPPIARIMGPGGSPTTSSGDATSEGGSRPRRLRQEPEVGRRSYDLGLRRRRGGEGTLVTGAKGGGPSLATSGLSRER
jgi:hypothetical protein